VIKELATAGGTTMVGRGEITYVAWEQIEPLLGLDMRDLQACASLCNP
jgi:hypothetical protein